MQLANNQLNTTLHMEYNDVIVLLGNCTDGDVQLVGGRNSKEGRVDVCVEGHWVTMCHDRWTHREAEVVCRQLHYLTSASSNAHMYMFSYGGLIYRKAIWTLKKYVLCCFIWSVVCSHTVVVALTGRSFGHYQNEDVYGFVAICDSDEARLGECQTDIEHCDSKESAGVICEGMHPMFKHNIREWPL